MNRPVMRYQANFKSCINTTSPRRIKYVKRIRRFQKPGITHDFPDYIPPIKQDDTPAIHAIASRTETNPNDLKGFFRNFFDTVSTSKQSGTFESELALFKNVNEPLKLLGCPTQLLGHGSTAETSLQWIKQSHIVPDLALLNNLLRVCVMQSKPDEAELILSRMPREFGVKPSDKSREIVAYAHLKRGNQDEALSILSNLEEISSLGQFVVWKLIRECLSEEKSDLAWSIFDGLRSKTLPAPEICASMLMNCGRHDLVEKAFKTFREIQAQGLQPHWLTHSALIYAASKRKEYYPKAVELFREMEGHRMPMDIRVYNHMLHATSKVADIATALELWNRLQESTDAKLKINDYTVANFLWTLAAVETGEDKISKRTYHYEMDSSELKRVAIEAFTDARKNHNIVPNTHVMNAYLAVMANHNMVEEAESIFHQEIKSFGLSPTPATFEIMLKMYDQQRNFDKTKELMEDVKKRSLSIGAEAWRAAIRTAALTTNLQVAIEWLRSMVSAGHRPSVEQMQVLHLRLCEEEKWQLRKEMGDLCLPPIKAPNNPFTDWRRRSVAIADLLEKVYGKDAPKLATKVDRPFRANFQSIEGE